MCILLVPTMMVLCPHAWPVISFQFWLKCCLLRETFLTFYLNKLPIILLFLSSPSLFYSITLQTLTQSVVTFYDICLFVSVFLSTSSSRVGTGFSSYHNLTTKNNAQCVESPGKYLLISLLFLCKNFNWRIIAL